MREGKKTTNHPKRPEGCAPGTCVVLAREWRKEGTGMAINSAPQWSLLVYEREGQRKERGFVTRKGKNDGGNEGRNFKKGKNIT